MFKWPRLLVLGYARHGKDTVSEILFHNYGLTFQTSSRFAAEKVVRPWLEKLGITYATLDALYADRVNHRKAWYDAICDYNAADHARLGKELYAVYDVYCGLRGKDELSALKKQGIVQYTFWVDAEKRVAAEDKASISVTKADADYIINNNGPLADLAGIVDEAMRCLKDG